MEIKYPNGITVTIRPVVRNIINNNIPKPPNLNTEVCINCQNYVSNNCKLKQGTIFDDKWTVCDFYKRKRSGAYRRKRAKYNKEGGSHGKEKY